MPSPSFTLLSLMVAVTSPEADSAASPRPPVDGAMDLVALASTNFNFDPAAAVADQEYSATQTATFPAESKVSDKPFGTTGTWRWNLIGSVATNFTDAITPQVNLGLSYFIMPNVSLDPQVTVLYAGQDGEDAVGAGVSLLFRWHFVHEETWSIYFEGGAGILFATDDIPAGTSNIDFTPQVLIGGTVDLGCNTRLMTAVGWYHMSNANTGTNNDGRDQLIGYVGLSFPF